MTKKNYHQLPQKIKDFYDVIPREIEFIRFNWDPEQSVWITVEYQTDARFITKDVWRFEQIKGDKIIRGWQKTSSTVIGKSPKIMKEWKPYPELGSFKDQTRKRKLFQQMTPEEIQSTFKLLDNFWYDQLDDPNVKVDWQPRIVQGRVVITFDDGSELTVMNKNDAENFKKNQFDRHDNLKLESNKNLNEARNQGLKIYQGNGFSVWKIGESATVDPTIRLVNDKTGKFQDTTPLDLIQSSPHAFVSMGNHIGVGKQVKKELVDFKGDDESKITKLWKYITKLLLKEQKGGTCDFSYYAQYTKNFSFDQEDDLISWVSKMIGLNLKVYSTPAGRWYELFATDEEIPKDIIETCLWEEVNDDWFRRMKIELDWSPFNKNQPLKESKKKSTTVPKGLDNIFYRLLYPEKRTVSAKQIFVWAKDAEANGEIEGNFGDDIYEAIAQLEDAGLITVGNYGDQITSLTPKEWSEE